MKKAINSHVFVRDLVSIIVPVYNSEKYLHRCIESIINQTYKNIEIILINDGSVDDSGKICDAYALSDKRIRVIHAENSGPAAARNVGIENSKGSFIFFVDSDDFIEADILCLLIKNYRRHDADIIIGDFNKIRNGSPEGRHKETLFNSKLLIKQDIVEYARCYLKRPNKFLLFAYSWGKLFRASIIKDNSISFDTNLHTFEDVAFNYDYLKHTSTVFYVEEALYNHLIQDNYMSATMTICGSPKKLFGYFQALENIGDFLQNHDSDSVVRKEVGHAWIYLTIIQFVRICGQINDSNKKRIYRLIHEIINDSNIRDNLSFYSPSKGDSRAIPMLMRLRLVWPIVLLCKYKARKRYGKRKCG